MDSKINFFKDLLLHFEKNKIDHIILRGQEFIQNEEFRDELDVLIKKSDLKKIKVIFRELLGVVQFKNNIDLTHPFLVRIVREDFIVDLDFQISGIAYCGSPILKSKYLFNNIEKENFYNILNIKGKFLMLLIHGFVFKKRFKFFKKYEKIFLELYNKSDKRHLKKEINKMFEIKLTEKIIHYLNKSNLKPIFSLRNTLIRKHLSKNPSEITKVFISKIMRFRNYFQLYKFFYFINLFKWAPMVSFIGSDGSGKSTLAINSKKYLDNFDIKNIIISSGVFSSIKNPLKKNNNTTYSERVSASKKQKNITELLARILLQIPTQLKIAYYRKKGIFVISDRYVYDIVNFYEAIGFLKTMVKYFSQKPTKIFYVKVNLKEILKRNKDLNEKAIISVMKRIESNMKYFSLIKLENENFKDSDKELKKHLNEIIKNV